jgi:ABC-type phosphonate transport system ATPase subunit
VLPNRAEAIRWALSRARPGDAVLIAGKGERPSPGGQQHHGFDDRLVARQWLREVGSHIEYEEERPRVISLASRLPLAN